MAETQSASVLDDEPGQPVPPVSPPTEDSKAEWQERFKKNERRDQLLVFVAAALAGDDQQGASPKSKAIRAVVIAEETIEQLVERGHLE